MKPGGDAFLLAAMIAVIVQEGLVKRDWLAEHADGLEQVLPHFTSLDVAAHAAKSGVPEEQVRSAARRIAAAESMATFEDLGVQMNLHSTLVSYLHKLLVLLTGNFGKKGAEYRPSTLVPQAFSGEERGTTPVTGAKIIGGLTPCNVVPDEILTDHPKRFRAMLVESGNPAHSIADGVRMREALAALELVVVIDVAFTETARLADYVLPVASQFEKAEATFFNFEFPNNYFYPAQGPDAAAAGTVLRGGAARAARRGARRAAEGRRRDAARQPGSRAAWPSARSSSNSSPQTRGWPPSRPSWSIARSAISCPRASQRARASGRSARSRRPGSRRRSRARASPARRQRRPTHSSTRCSRARARSCSRSTTGKRASPA